VGALLGKHTIFGNVSTTPTGNPLMYDFQSTAPQETIAANGDMIFFTSSGQVELIPIGGTYFSAIWTGEFVAVGGTG